jgi:CheY-like chemotaxis protein
MRIVNGLSQPAKLISFLLVEDDDDHAQLVIRGLNQHIAHHIDHVKDGSEALAFLFRQGKYQSYSLPDVILLDLKLPKIDGHEVLRKIKSDPTLMMIPAVILTTSSAEADRFKAYRHHANSYLVKPLDFASFRKMAEDLDLYWGIWNQPPTTKVKS